MNLKLSIVNYQLSILLLLFFALPIKAQVTIGAQKVPHSYSVLELESTKGGFRLPMLNSSERDALNLTADSTEASGLVIFNTDIDCVEFWSDGKWIDLCANVLPSANINPATLANLSSGSGYLSGRIFFDIGVTDGGTACGTAAEREANKADFSTTSAYSYIFTASAMGTVQNVRYVIQDSENVLQVSQSLSGTLVPGILASNTSAPALVLNFKPDLNLPGSPIIGLTRSNAAHVIINIIYNNGSTDVKIVTTLSIQDCSCGCPVKTTAGGWLTFMCYNLGAAAAVQSLTPDQQASYSNFNIADEYGDTYEWGRVADGHQSRSAVAVDGGSAPRDISYDSNSQIPVGDIWYGVPVYFSGGIVDWHGNDNGTKVYRNDNLWDDTYPANNPCPEGWRVPTAIEWQSIADGTTEFTATSAGYTCSSGNTWKWTSSPIPGYLITPLGSSAPTLFLPVTGYRDCNNGTVLSGGAGGYYWSSSVGSNGTPAYALVFNSVNIVKPSANYPRAIGFSVRCVAK